MNARYYFCSDEAWFHLFGFINFKKGVGRPEGELFAQSTLMKRLTLKDTFFNHL
jgi:hypothetical protein